MNDLTKLLEFPKDSSMEQQQYTFLYNNNYAYLRNLVIKRFVWNNLPSTIDSRFIERSLIDYGLCAFYDSNIANGYVALPCTGTGDLNIYGEFNNYQAYGYGGQSLLENVNIDNAVLIRNNAIYGSTEHYLRQYAKRLTDIDVSIDINVLGQRTPYFIMTDEETRLTMKNIWKKIVSGTQAIFVKKDVFDEDTLVHQTVSPYVTDKLNDHKKVVMNEFYTLIGVNNSNVDKKERLLTDEVNANNEGISLSAKIMLDERQKACDRINEMFGLNVSVELYRGEEDEQIHIDSETTSGEQSKDI